MTYHRERDQGAYTCEVLNSRKRILAQPDAILTVRDCNGQGGNGGHTNGGSGDDSQFEQPGCNPAGTLKVDPYGRCQCKVRNDKCALFKSQLI